MEISAMSIMWTMEERAPYRVAATSPSTLGELVRNARVSASMTQAELAERAGISERGISDIERGVIESPNVPTLRSLVAALCLPDHTARAILDARGPRARRHRPSVPQPLRVPLTPLIDREHERAELARLVRSSDTRLISLIGPGGIGKSRLALALATALDRAFNHQVAFVALEDAADASQALVKLLQTLNVTVSRDQPLQPQIIDALRGRAMLLVLDNVEHLPLNGCIVDLLTACPNVRLIITSRHPLRIRGEHQFLVTPLALPKACWFPEAEAIEQAPATALFLQTARRLPIDLPLTPLNCADITTICRLAEGVPLRIEHAASLLTTRSLAEIAREMRDPLTCLRDNGPADLPERHKSLEASVRWSYDLLPADEQWLLRLLATIDGDFSDEVVYRRAAMATGGHVSPHGIAERLGSLVEKHLVNRRREQEQTRYSLADHIRAFARAQSDLCQHASAVWARG
jgi:predicted ATPase/transcriptional regulator with XRE-family HTH domain